MPQVPLCLTPYYIFNASSPLSGANFADGDRRRFVSS